MRIWVGTMTQALYIIFKSVKIWYIKKDAYVNFLFLFLLMEIDVYGGYLIHCFCALTFCIWHCWNFLYTYFFDDILGYRPTIVTPSWAWLFLPPSNGSPSLHIPTNFLNITYTDIPDNFRMGVSEIVALVAFIALQFILLHT